MGRRTLDERLRLAAELYISCAVGADVGTDHGLLPCHLLRQGICDRMILADVSPKALRHAAEEVRRQGLEDRARLVCADGFAALEEPCGCVSVTGIGGRTLARMLLAGRDRLRGAVLVLSAHTEQPEVRRAVRDIGYHFTREEVCQSAGRWYVVWRAEPGSRPTTEKEIACGGLLFEGSPEKVLPYLAERRAYLAERLAGLRLAWDAKAAEAAETLRLLRIYEEQEARIHDRR